MLYFDTRNGISAGNKIHVSQLTNPGNARDIIRIYHMKYCYVTSRFPRKYKYRYL